MWGLLRPHTPQAGASHPCTCGRTESCTLRILTDAFTGAHEEGKKKKAEVRAHSGVRGHPRRLVPHWSADD